MTKSTKYNNTNKYIYSHRVLSLITSGVYCVLYNMPIAGEKMNNFDGLSDKRVKKSKKLPKDIIGVRVPHNYVILPNTDYRYWYPKRFASFLNNADPAGLRKFLLEHCTDDCTIIYRYNGETNPVGPLLSKLKSPIELANVWDTALVIYPDYVFKIVDTVVQRDADSNCSFIKSSYISSFTKLLKPNILSSNGENGNNGPPALLEDGHTPGQTESSAAKPTAASSYQSIAITSTVAVTAELTVDDEEEEEDEPLDDLIDYWFLNETGGEVKTTDISKENKAASSTTTTTAVNKHSSSDTSQSSSSMTSTATREDLTIKSDANVEQNNLSNSNSNGGKMTKKRRRRINEVEAVTTFINSEIDAETKWLNGKLLPSPVSIEYHGKFVMHLNDEGKINKIVYFYKLAEHLEEGFKLY